MVPASYRHRWHRVSNCISLFALSCCLATCAFAAAEPTLSGALKKCAPDAPCSIRLLPSLVGGDPTLMAVSEDHVCGAPPDSRLQATNPVPGTFVIAADANQTLFELGVMGPSPGLYRLCLCSDNCMVSTGTQNPLAFNTDVGDLLVRGPIGFVQTPDVCVAGGPSCMVNITALGISLGDMLAVSRNASSCSSEPFEVVGPIAPTLPATVWYAIVFGSLEFVLEHEVAAAEAAAIPSALHAALAGHFQIEPNRLFVTRLLHGSESQPVGDMLGRRLLSEEPWLAEYQAVLPWTAAIVIERFVMDYNLEDDSLNSSFFAVLQFELEAAGMNMSLISVNFTDVKLQRLTADAASKYVASLQWQDNNTGDSNASNEPGEHNSQDLNMTSDELSDTENVSRKLTGLMQVNASDNISDDSFGDGADSDESPFELNDSANSSDMIGNEQMEEVQLMMRVASVDYAALVASPELLSDVKATVARQVAQTTGVAIEQVRVHASEGSLQLAVAIQTPRSSTSQVRGSLIAAADAGTLADELAAHLSMISGISEVVNGPIIVDMQSVDLTVLGMNETTNQTLPLLARSSVLTDHIAFDLKLAGGTWLLCYRFAGGNASMAVGELEVLGAGLLTNGLGGRLEPVATHEFDVEVSAPFSGLRLEDRLLFIESPASCGHTPSTVYFTGNLNVSGTAGSTNDANTSLLWKGLAISRPGMYVACWCWSGNSQCSSHEDYNLELDRILVRGPLGFEPLEVPAGHSFDLVLLGVGLSKFDAVRLSNMSGADCGNAPLENAEQLRGDIEAASSGDGSERRWTSLMLMEPGTYTLCWCAGSDPNACSAAESYDLSLGLIEVWGPEISSHRCVMGSSCSVILTGVPSYESSSILLRTGSVACEGATSAPVSMKGLTNPQHSETTESHLYTAFRFIPVRARSGDTVQIAELLFYFQGSQVDLPGAVARRLPGGNGPEEEDARFAVDGRRATKFLDFRGVGFEVTLQSPRQVDAVAYVTANDAPERDPVAFMLEGLSDSWRPLAAPARLSPPTARHQETVIIAATAALDSNQTVYRLGVPVEDSPGLSTICWQKSTGFSVEAGSLEFSGLMERREQHCFVGSSCTFGPVAGFALSPADLVVAIPSTEYCSQGQGQIGTASVSSRAEWAGPWATTLEVDSGQHAVLVELPHVPAGKWKLCYCVHTDEGCPASRYSIDMGMLDMAGPLPATDFTCMLNASTCTIGPVVGYDLSVQDQVMLFPSAWSCGNVSGSSDASSENLTELDQDLGDLAGLVLDAAQSPHVFEMPNASERTGSPGTWKICYCVAQGDRCSSHGGFSATLGNLVIVGPDLTQQHACTLGMPCHVVLDGHGLSRSNAIMIVDVARSCGSAEPLLSHSGLQWPQRPTPQGVNHYFAGTATAGNVGPVGRLCWAFSWSHWADFQVDLGLFYVAGPEQHRSFVCTIGIPCTLSVQGYNIPESSGVWLIGGDRPVVATWEASALERSCSVADVGDAASVEGFDNPASPQNVSLEDAAYPLGIASAGAVGPFFRVCWRPSPALPFAVELGRFSLVGPEAAVGVCVKGYPCDLTLGGYGLNPENTLQIAESNCTFNASAGEDSDVAMIPGLLGLAGFGAPLRPRQGTAGTYDLGTVRSGRAGLQLVLCWSGEPGSEFTPIGSLYIAGPDGGQELVCDSGSPCQPNIQGFSSPMWKEYWLVTGSGQYIPNFSIFLSSRCEPVWGQHGGDLTHTWERIPAGEKDFYYYVSGKLQACPNYVLHLDTVSCAVVASPWTGSGGNIAKQWIQLSDDAGSYHWLLSPSGSPCPHKMLAAEAGTLRPKDFFRSPLAQWKIVQRDSAPWPHRSSLLLLPEGTGCNVSDDQAAIRLQREGLTNPAQCCERSGQSQQLKLLLSFGEYETGPGRFDICWARTSGDGLSGGADNPAPASEFPVWVGVLTLLAPQAVGQVGCTLGQDCLIEVSGLGLSSLDSIVIHTGDSCDWPQLPPFNLHGAPNCASSGHDSFVDAQVIGDVRWIIATTCPRTASSPRIVQPKVLLRSYSMPAVAQLLQEDHYLPLPNGTVGVALDGLAISGAEAPDEGMDECGLVVAASGAAYYATTPGFWHSDRGPCIGVLSWASAASASYVNESHELLLGFMMDGVPLFAPLANDSNFTTDSCGGHADDLPFYHYHATASGGQYSNRLVGCLRAVAKGGHGFSPPPAPVAWPELRPLDVRGLAPNVQHGRQEVLLQHAREAARFLPRSVENASRALYSISQPSESALAYSICWGHGLALDMHHVLLGTLKLSGPFKNDFRCTFALTCVLSVTGSELVQQNRLVLSNGSCADDNHLPAFRHVALAPTSAIGNVSTFDVGIFLPDAVADISVQVCWKAFADALPVDVGSLELVGPTQSDAVAVCSPTRPCDALIREYMPGTAVQAVLGAFNESCESGMEDAAFVGARDSVGQQGPESWSYTFGRLQPGMPPGIFSLCWHPVGQDGVVSELAISAGALIVRGLRSLEVEPPLSAGIASRLTLRGVGMLLTDQIRVVENAILCGSDKSNRSTHYVVELVQDTSASVVSALALTPTDTRDLNSSDMFSESLVTWNITLQVGGRFRVCWCPSDGDGSDCTAAADFAVDAGLLVSRGPTSLGDLADEEVSRRLSQTSEYVAGVPFTLRLQGFMLHVEDRVKILPADQLPCNDAVQRPYLDEAGAFLENPHVFENGLEEEWANTTILASGRYDVCWCAASLEGPFCSGAYTLISGLTVEGAQIAFGLSGTVLEIFAGIQTQLEVWGTALTGADQVKVVPDTEQRCVAAAVDDFVQPSLLKPTYIAHGMGESFERFDLLARRPPRCRICWCSGVASQPCSAFPETGEQSWVDLGTVEIYGPTSAVPEGVAQAGVVFTLVAFGGVGLPASVSASAFLRSEHFDCDSTTVPNDVQTSGGHARVTVPTSNVSEEWVWPGVQISSPGSFRVCVQLAACLMKPCSRGHKFGFGKPWDLGVFSVGGPRSLTAATPFSGLEFEVTLQGLHLTVQDQLQIVEDAHACGHLPAVSASQYARLGFKDLDNATSNNVSDSSSSLTADDAEIVWEMEPLPAAGLYRICWCSSWRACTADAFLVDAGTIAAFGPDGQAETVCVKGAACDLRLHGIGMTLYGPDPPVVLLHTNCTETDEAILGQLLSASPERLEVQWPSLLHLSVGNYRLCWAVNENLVNQSVDAGSIMLAGPSPYPAAHCISGRLCSVLDVAGVGLSIGDRITARNSACGAFDEDLGDGRIFRVSPTPDSFETAEFFTAVSARYIRIHPTNWYGNISLRAGLVVQVCASCISSTMVDVSDDARSFSSVRPSMSPSECFSCGRLDSATAWVAEQAELGEWYQLDAGKILSISGVVIRGRADADEWITEFVVSYSMDGSAWNRLREMRGASGFPNSGVAVGLMSQGKSQFTWPGSIAARGDTYTLCWRRSDGTSGPSQIAEFVTTLGWLIVDGPQGGQTWQCKVAKSCEVSGLQGLGLRRGDLLRPLPLCSVSDTSVPYAAAWDDLGTGFDWGWSLQGYLPRTYRLCWCRPWNDTQFLNDSTPGVVPGCGPNNVLVDAGVLSLTGPNPDNFFTCLSGEECVAIPLLGEQLNDNDMLLVMYSNESCGDVPTPIPGMPNLGFSDPADARGTRFYWREAPVTASGADYRLCWCSPSFSDCNNSADFDTVAGTLRLIGPVRDQTRTCVAGLPCTLQNLSGHYFSDGSVAAQQFCDTDPAAMNRTDFQEVGFGGSAQFGTDGDVTWAEPNRANGGIYKLCWKGVGQTSFGGEIGSIVVLGPVADHRRMASDSSPLIVSLFQGAAGTSASQMGDRVRIADSCLSSPTAVAGVEGAGISQKLEPNATSFRWGESLLSAPGGEYRMCWCAGHQLDNSPRACELPGDFAVDVGSLAISGPAGGQAWSCDTSRPCSISGLRGAGLTENDRLLIKEGNCFGGTPLRGLHWASVGTFVSAGGTLANVTWGNQTVAAEGGHYRVCFCTLGFGEPCNSQVPHRFTTDAGTLTVNGPRPAHAPWAVQFGGEGNDTASHVLVDSAEPEKGLGHALLAGTTSGTIVNPETTRGIAEASGMTWTEGRSASDYIDVECGWMRHDSGDEQWRATCRYLKLSLQPLNFTNFGLRDAWVTKVGYNGSILWTRQLGSFGDNILAGLALNRQDHSVFVAGSTSDNMLAPDPYAQDGAGTAAAASGGTDCWIIKLSQYGEYINAFQFGSNMNDFIGGIVVASDGLYAAAIREDQMLGIPPEGGLDSVIVKFTLDLTFVWAGLVGGEGNDIVHGLHLYTGSAEDGRERVLAFGTTDSNLYAPSASFEREDVILTIYSIGPYANFERGRQVGSAGVDVATGVTSGPDGSIYVAGYSDDNLFFDWDPRGEIPDPKPGDYDGFVMKFTESLVWVWTAMPGTPAKEYIYGIVFLPGFTEQTSDLLISGTSGTFWPETDSRDDVPVGATDLGRTDAWMMTLSTSDGGFSGWQKQLRSPGDQILRAMAAEAAGGHIYAAGSAVGGYTPEIGATPLVGYGEEDALLLKLVWGRAAARCYRGSACEAGIPSGIGLASTDVGLLSPTRCGSGTVNAAGVPNTAADGLAVDDGSGDTSGLRQRLKWGNPVEGRILEAAVGRYVLCWCSGGCDGAVPLEISAVFISGPDPDQRRTCVRGQACDVTGIRGRDLDSWDRVAVMDSCAGNFAGFPQGGHTSGIVAFKSQKPEDLSCATVTPDEIEGVSSNFGCGRVTASAGQYKLCFCTPRGAGTQCAQNYDFGFEIGVMIVQGPLSGQPRKCTLDQRCAVDNIQGVGLKPGDLILILDECRMPQTDQAKGDMTIRGVAGLTAESPVATSDGSFYVIAHPATAHLGTYRMCWCRPDVSPSGCTLTDDFAAEIGPLSLVSPVSNHYRRCIRGQICSIIDLEGFGLADGDVVHVLNFCPEPPTFTEFQADVTPPGILVDQWPRGGLSLPAQLGGRSVSWGEEAVMNPVGIYQLCWCMGSAGHRCLYPQDFYVRLGELEVAGPVPSQSFLAVAGHPLTLPNVEGYGLEVDHIAIVPHAHNCTGPWKTILAAAAETGFPSGGLLISTVAPHSPADNVKFETANFTAGMQPVPRGGGDFALCMHRRGFGDNAFAARGYQFLGCGNEDEARAACTPAPLPMPKSQQSQANLEAAVTEAREQGVQVSPCGMGLWLGARWYSSGHWMWDDGSMLLNGSFDDLAGHEAEYMNWAVGQPSAINHSNEPLVYMRVPDGGWHDAREQKHSFAIVCQEFASQATGSLQLQGPYSGQNFSAVAGHPLQLSGVAGLGLSAGDLLLAAEAGKPCGQAEAVHALGGEGISYPSPDGTTFNFTYSTKAPGRYYQLCWCRIAASTSGTSCRRASDFVVFLGDLLLQGPELGKSYVCFSGEDCTLRLSWLHEDAMTAGMATFATDCDGLGRGLQVAGTSGSTSGTSVFRWRSLHAFGGHYGVCWCASPCDLALHPHLAFHVGTLDIHGPFAEQTFTCLQQRECHAAPVKGLHLQDGDQLKISTDAVAHMPCNSSDMSLVSLPSIRCGTFADSCTFIWPAAVMANVQPGAFNLCWCRHGTGCMTSVDFALHVGTLAVIEASGFQ
ncbi:unnamed protein product [Symbiodinium necroappetens]|uniref:Uncharacterized protein n=1 Tax=Symbiodinium necroappetens TaxID=1628268 RepID=A0A812YCB6_9DINO|nr:unnamed protein product [Symbiodinium necroappetens]